MPLRWPSMWSRSSAAACVLALGWTALSPGSASAAACCVGGTTSELGRLGPCEFFTVGLGTSFEGRIGSWSRSGELRQGNDRRITQRLIGSMAVRPTRHIQFGVSFPMLFQWKRVGGMHGVGGGPGDTTVWSTLEPFQDTSAPSSAPMPEFGLSLTLPTGIPLEAKTAPVGAGATGTGYFVVTPSMRLGRTFLGGSLFGTASVGLAIPRVGAKLVPGASWEVALAGAWFAQRDVSMSVSGGVRGLTAGLVHGETAGTGSLEPFLGAGVALTTRNEGRVTLGMRHSIPLPAIGRSQEATVLFVVNVAYVTKSRPLPPML